MQITLGPVLYNWPTPEWVDFYSRIADEAPVERVILGEVICSKRTPFRTGAMADVAGGRKPELKHRFYHVPASNTAVGHMILEN